MRHALEGPGGPSIPEFAFSFSPRYAPGIRNTERTATSLLLTKGRFMDDRQFDTLVRTVATRQNRRALIRRGLGVGALLSGAVSAKDAGAARRGFSGPTIPTLCVPSCDGSMCGDDGCGGTCSCNESCPCLTRLLDVPATPVCVSGYEYSEGHPYSQSECEAKHFDWSDPSSGACVLTCLAS
jgi:hypothetical protein